MLREKLNGLGLFSQIKIIPYVANKNDSKAELYDIELLIDLKEKNFGNAEFFLGVQNRHWKLNCPQ